MKLTQEQIEQMHKDLIEKGKLIEAGWIGFRVAVFPHGAGAQQLDTCKECFFAGAQHLFASIMTVLDPDENPTEDDMRRMNAIHEELQAFIEQFKLKYLSPSKGEA